MCPGTMNMNARGFMSYSMNHSLHALKDTLSLNEGQPLIRPITEVATLMKENIQPAKNREKNVLLKETD
ncbi:unnamed protein product [Rotaria sp. Silwood1]|nr:unnamed protein product [Rotaria sp. Silwood1]